MNLPAEPQTQIKDRDDPTSVAEVLGTLLDRDAYIAHAERMERRQPESFYPLGVCRHCQTSLGDQPDDKVMSVGAFGWLPNVCCRACSDKAQAQWIQDEKLAQEGKFRAIIPPEFIAWDDQKGNTKAKLRVFTRFSFTDRKGFVLHGSSGSCKTRIMWQMVRVIVEENSKQDMERQFSYMVCDSFEVSTAKKFPPDAERVDFLFIDDLGNEPTSTAFETALLHLMRKRLDWHRPTIITTQLNGAAFRDRFFLGNSAQAILRRYRDSSVMIDTDNLSVAGMGSAGGAS